METAENQEKIGINWNSDGLKCYKTFFAGSIKYPWRETGPTYKIAVCSGTQDENKENTFGLSLALYF